ncbi:MAG: hypothetical protein IPH52_18565 [Leptospiraceae bacterium]|nr:hypothetical protein [Leptospiraceae bacterium]
MKAFFAKSVKSLIVSWFIASFVLSLSIVPFSQAKAFQKPTKSSNAFQTFRSQAYATEYNLSSFIYSEEDYRFNQTEENRNYLQFLTFTIPYFNPLHHYFKNSNTTSNHFSYLNYKLYSIPPPGCS